MERSDTGQVSALAGFTRSPEWWANLAIDCREAAFSFPALHPDANFFRLAQNIAEEQAGLRERPAGLMLLPSGCDDSRSL